MGKQVLKLDIVAKPGCKIKTDCFAYRESAPDVNGIIHCKCNAIKNLDCAVGHCNFYKTVEDYYIDKAKISERLSRIDWKPKEEYIEETED